MQQRSDGAQRGVRLVRQLERAWHGFERDGRPDPHARGVLVERCQDRSGFLGVRIGAAVVILEAVEGLRGVGAFVDFIVEGVAVFIGAGAALLLGVFGHQTGPVRAGVVAVGHAISVVVGIRAAVGILEAVAIFGLLRALVVLI